jgi:hypothetical protein
MANPYLIQALYGPKPTAPTAFNVEASNDNRQLAPALTPPSHPLTPAEKLHGKDVLQKAVKEDYIHPERRHRDDVDGRLRAALAENSQMY